MRVEVRLPQWGMGMSEGIITQWFKKVGDAVTEDEPHNKCPTPWGKNNA